MYPDAAHEWRTGMNVGGHRQPRTRHAIQRGQDPNQIYEAACIDLADDLGWERGIVVYWWSQLALARQHVGQPQAMAEHFALDDVRAVFDKRGCAPS